MTFISELILLYRSILDEGQKLGTKHQTAHDNPLIATKIFVTRNVLKTSV